MRIANRTTTTLMQTNEKSSGATPTPTPTPAPAPAQKHLPWGGTRHVSTVLHAIDEWCALQPTKTAYTWLNLKCEPEVKLSYKDVVERSSVIAYVMRHKWGLKPGDRAVLLYPMGLNFVIGFWACLRAGVIAVPVYPPSPGSVEKDLVKLRNSIQDCSPKCILTDSEYQRGVAYMNAQAALQCKKLPWPAGVPWHATDGVNPPSNGRPSPRLPYPTSDQIAFIQYTSGSTSDPKGVMVLHSNLVANLAAAFNGLNVYPHDVLVTWLPQYHDLGLIGYFIDSLVVGASCVAFSPLNFVRRPAMWMRVMSQYKGTVSSAPNFGYALAARKTLSQQARELDLSHVRILMDAAEPIRGANITAFLSKFCPAGLPVSAYMPGYGLAEHVIFVSGLQKERALPSAQCSPDSSRSSEPRGPRYLVVNRMTLEEDKVARVQEEGHLEPQPLEALEAGKDDDSGSDQSTTEGSADSSASQPEDLCLVSCGLPFASVTVKCVDQSTFRPLPDLHVGEVWIAGPSVTKGYWGREELTTTSFNAELAPGSDNSDKENMNSSHGEATKFFRTGDLGFYYKSELYICGREKDLVIIAGRNICPQDVERDVEEADSCLRPGCTAAFSIIDPNSEEEESLAIVAEVREKDMDHASLVRVAENVMSAVQQSHRLVAHCLILLPPRTVCKTTSGKIQRKRNKRHFQDGMFTPLLVQGRGTYTARPPSSSSQSPVVRQTTRHLTAVAGVFNLLLHLVHLLFSSLFRAIQAQRTDSTARPVKSGPKSAPVSTRAEAPEVCFTPGRSTNEDDSRGVKSFCEAPESADPPVVVQKPQERGNVPAGYMPAFVCLAACACAAAYGGGDMFYSSNDVLLNAA